MECKSIQSIASSSMIWRYDVFVSFRGEDVRNSFANHLLGALQRKGIVAFKDDRNIKQGEHISTELMEAIEESQVLIVVFSKNFATSSWCLRELAKIVDCMNREVPAGHRQVVMPVFYDVSPSEVRKQSGDYGKAFAEHEERFKHELEMVQRWREALVQVADLFGSDIQNKPQFTEIEKIVKRVMSILSNKFSCLPNDLVGTHSHLDELEKFLVLDSHNDVQVIGIWGMGGIGKTTLAQVLYHRISHQYDACCFIDDVSKVYQGHGPLGVHKQLHCQVLNEDNQEVWSISRATYLTRTILSKIKAFIVLDNVDEVKQLEGLAVNRDLLCAGSKIIVVSRNKHIFEQFGVNKVYQVQCLNEDDALQLFCRKAFRSDYVLREYEELTYRALEYAQGHPLAIRVLGSSLLLGRNISEWTSALDSLRDDPDKEIMNVLRISVDGLRYTEKEIFLDIACFFNCQDSIQVKRILSCFGFHPEIGIRVLTDHSLISVDQCGVIRMHDMLVELGKKIVREKAPKEPRKWSRIWRNKDFQNIISDKMTMEDLEAVQLDRDVQEMDQKKALRAEVLSAMSHLRLLIVKDAYFSGSLDCLSNKLQYLDWFGYPFNNLPSSFEPNELVEMILPCSTITTLWEGTKHLHSLRIMNLQHSKNLIKTPDFRGLTNLEELDLEGCTKLVEIHPSIGLLRKLIVLNLKNCISLRSLPYSVFCLSSLEVLNLSRCSKVFSNQLSGNGRHTEHLKKLDVSETGMMRKSTSSILKKISFQFFSSPKKNKIVGLLSPSFQCLQELDLYFCNLHRIPDAIGCLHGLEKLNLGGNNFVALPSSMKELPRLKSLYLMHCQQLKYLPELTLSTDLLTRTKTTFVFYENVLPGLYIFNCPNLIEIENWSKIAVSWMIQFLKIHHQSWPRRAEFHCVVPGSQVPMWFDKQSSDNTLVLDPVLTHDSEWIGLALCAAFVAPVGYSAILDESTGHLPMQFSLGRSATGSGSCFFIPVLMDKGLVKDDSHHLLLLYLPREALIWDTRKKYDLLDGNTREVFLRFSFTQVPGYRYVVKKWGFRLVFKQDLESEELIPTMSNLNLEPSNTLDR